MLVSEIVKLDTVWLLIGGLSFGGVFELCQDSILLGTMGEMNPITTIIVDCQPILLTFSYAVLSAVEH